MGTDEERHLKAKFGDLGDQESGDVKSEETAILKSEMTKQGKKESSDETAIPDPTLTTSASPIAHGPFAKIEIQQRAAGESEEELMTKLRTLMDHRDLEDSKEKDGERESDPTSARNTNSDASNHETVSNSSQPQQEIQSSFTSTQSASSKKSHDQAHEDAVFKSSYIPRTLDEVYDPERDAEILNRGDGDQLIYAGVTGLGEAGSKSEEKREHKVEKRLGGGANDEQKIEKEGEDEDDEEESDESDSGGEDDEDDDADRDGKKKAPRGHRHEDRDVKKVSSKTSSSYFTSIAGRKLRLCQLCLSFNRNEKPLSKKRLESVARRKCPRLRRSNA